MSFINFLRSNILYLIWFTFYFAFAWLIFGANRNSLLIVSIIYIISITVALSPLGEMLLRFIEGCRLPKTEREKNYLLPLFEEAYENAKDVNPSLNKGINIYIMDAMYVNAFAMGRKTVAVTRGAMETFNAEELKGIIAHELGHITHGHTKALLLTNIGNILFTAIVFVLRLIVQLADSIAGITAYFNIMGIVFKVITFITGIFFYVSVFVFVNLGELILSLNSRANEMQADKFAYTTGFGKQLIDSLYLLQKISLTANVKPYERLKASHPHIASRIEQLERLESAENEE